MKLEQYRNDKGMTFAQLGEHIGLGKNRAKDAERYCKGETTPKRKTMRNIYEATDGQVTPNDFFGLAGVDTNKDSQSAA